MLYKIKYFALLLIVLLSSCSTKYITQEKKDDLSSSYLKALKSSDIVVAQDGSGNYKTVQGAFNAVPDSNSKRTVIFIKNGRYKEKLVLGALKQKVTIIGESVEGVMLTYDDHSGKKIDTDTINTYTSYSTSIEADDFIAENITFENSAGRVGQAVALMVKSDRVQFKNCRFIGNQDTFFTNTSGRIYVKDTYIEGTTDFIFGNAIALFENCTMYSKKKSHVTAASTPEGNKFGYVFKNCKLTADSGLVGVTLGRPWRPFARVVYMNCEIGKHIDSVGWNNWRNPENEKTAFYAEYKNFGSGVDISKRVTWSKQLTDKEAENYTVEKIFASESRRNPFPDNWILSEK
ncbi:MAG: pectin esterase [Ignavibacteriales bacterium]|nr:pectin esterase [Ignavibacteriales bacterium]